MPSPDVVNDWHDTHRCHKHPSTSVYEGVCCVCDAEDPCSGAVYLADLYDAETCPGRNRRGERCDQEPGDNSRGLCVECLVEHYEDMRERYLLDQHNARTGATL